MPAIASGVVLLLGLAVSVIAFVDGRYGGGRWIVAFGLVILAALLAVVALRRGDPGRRWIARAVLVAAVPQILLGGILAVAVFRFFPSIERQLRARQIPVLPVGAEIVRTTRGGLFSHWFYLKATLGAEDYAAYQAAVVADGGTVLAIPAQVVIRDRVAPPATAGGIRTIPTPRVHGEPLPWWDIDTIADGIVVEKPLPGACRYRIFFRNADRTVFVEWSYS